jgi:nicotinamide mononucleotide (NMN) deamidase PncC
MLRFLSMLLVLGLSACASSEPRMAWIRVDGQTLNGNPALSQQIEVDQTICSGEGAKAELNSSTPEGSFTGFTGPTARQIRAKDGYEVFTGCMAAKGYVAVREDQAEAKRQEFATVAAAKQAQEAAQAPPPPPPAPKKPRKTPPRPDAATPGK